MEYRSDQEGEGQGQWRTAYYLYDGQGNVRQLVNSRGQVIATYNYLPFGEMMNRGMRGQGIEENEGMGMNWGEENGLRNTITYQGREYDRDSGLYYFRARYQNPTLGRFLEVDPLLREVPEYTAGNSFGSTSAKVSSECPCSSEGYMIGSSIPSLPINSTNLMFYMAILNQMELNALSSLTYKSVRQQINSFLPKSVTITNPYMLENNNPMNLIDPLGTCTVGAEQDFSRIGRTLGNWAYSTATFIHQPPEPGYAAIICIFGRLITDYWKYEKCVSKTICQNGKTINKNVWEQRYLTHKWWEKQKVDIGSHVAFSKKEVKKLCEKFMPRWYPH